MTILIAGTLHKHLQRHGIDYLQFSFRWMNNLLTREIPLRCSIRLWDTYLAESDSFASFQLYVCAAFLLHWRQELLLERDFQVQIIFGFQSLLIVSSVPFILYFTPFLKKVKLLIKANYTTWVNTQNYLLYNSC